MDETVMLLLLSLAMLVGCYLAGSIPLAFNFSEDKLKLVTVLGAGLLVGTALAVIIPEGVHTLYEAQTVHHHSHSEVEAAADVAKGDEKSAKDPDAVGLEHTELHTWIGVALVLGFIFMLIVDQIGGGLHHHAPPDSEVGGNHTQSNRNRVTATLGLVVHAAADGIALGAAANTSQTHVEMIVFVAIMLHKAPAAFGLVSFLLHEGFDRNRIRKHLAMFAMAAPLFAVLTYFGLSQITSCYASACPVFYSFQSNTKGTFWDSNKETLSSVNATGIAMLFSAGTFLYVATVHVLPELARLGGVRTVSADGSVVVKEGQGFTKCELLLMVIGALLPLVLSVGHHH